MTIFLKKFRKALSANQNEILEALDIAGLKSFMDTSNNEMVSRLKEEG